MFPNRNSKKKFSTSEKLSRFIHHPRPKGEKTKDKRKRTKDNWGEGTQQFTTVTVRTVSPGRKQSLMTYSSKVVPKVCPSSLSTGKLAHTQCTADNGRELINNQVPRL
jgi:hypothetical protein